MFMLRDLLRLSVDEHLGFILVLVWRHFGFMDVFKNVWDGKLQVGHFICLLIKNRPF
jgi:hypothetical protein